MNEAKAIVEKLVTETKEDVTKLSEVIDLLQKAVRRITILKVLTEKK